MPPKPTILITGAAGNLGGLLAMHLARADADHECRLRLMVHTTPVAAELDSRDHVTTVKADLAEPGTLPEAVEGVDVVVHFAGVLFAPKPEKFLPETNTRWFNNLLEACLKAKVKRVILISFPHTEGPTTLEQPATGKLDGNPVSAHATTRAEEERLLMNMTQGTDTTPVILRLGMVYGTGILMVDAAHWLAKRRLLGVWREPTWIHLISTADYLATTEAAIFKPDVQGIYHVGDEQPVTLQQFLDEACAIWKCRRPWRMPPWLIYAAAWCCETIAMIFRTKSGLTRDFITIGRVSYVGDTKRMREELLPSIQHTSLKHGKHTLITSRDRKGAEA